MTGSLLWGNPVGLVLGFVLSAVVQAVACKATVVKP
jgi:hypothetical protein